MVYDPKWEVVTKPSVFSLESLIAWLETKPAEATYNFHDCEGSCLLDQYGDAMGIEDDLHRYSKLNAAFDIGDGDGRKPPFIASKTPFTFGAALDRARAALSRSPQETE